MIRFTKLGLELSQPVVKALLAFASEDPERPHLMGIGVDDGDVCATDGHSAVRFERAEVDGVNVRDYEARVFARAYVERVAKETKRGELVSLRWVSLSDESVRFARLSSAEPKDGVSSEDLPIAWDSRYLSRLELVARACRRERERGESEQPFNPPVMLVALGGYLDACRYVIGGDYWDTAVHEAHVSIMPMNMRVRGMTSDAETVRQAREKQAKKQAAETTKRAKRALATKARAA